ncbi:outer membrane protein [Roseicitreum antarcticum]|uniref:Outer membrane protein n=2 Tax=Roseicitreum antarcticum TaxID=564137 RepID=A0A1H2XFV5_9RHOB|nr:outer membrane protein [Roseicitreum antarcticum]
MVGGMIRTVIFGAALAAATLVPTGSRAQSLADTLIAAYRTSNLLEQNRATLRAADEDVAIALATLRPVVNFVARGGISRSTGAAGVAQTSTTASLDLSAEVTLLDFGRGQLAKDAAREQVLAVRQALIGVEQNVLLNAVGAFMDTRNALETVALREANVRLITRELRATEERFSVGEVTRTDIAIAEARLAGARAQLAAAQGDLAAAREGYKLVTGAYPTQLGTPPSLPRTAASLSAAQDIARVTHPAIKQAQHEVTAAELNAERALAARHGSVSASASTGLSARDPGNGGPNASIGLTYQRPIYQGGRLSATHRQALARRDAARAALHQTVAEVLQNVANSWANVAVASAQLQSTGLQVTASQTAYDGVREEATLGTRTILDVLNAEQELLNARTSRLSAQATQQTASYAVLGAMGLLTVDYLNLGIPTYDPEAYFNAVQNAPVTSRQGEALDRVLRTIGRP